jgi:hypothetical protein
MTAASIDNLLDALRPDPKRTNFPVPRRVLGTGGAYQCESFFLTGVPMPGQWLLTECTRTFGWQVQKGYGLTGATLLPIGDDPLTAKFSVKIWESTGAAAYRQLLRDTLRKPVGLIAGSTSSAGMGIEHPQLNDMGVVAVVVKSVTPLMNPLVTSGGKGPWTATVEFYEYRAPIPALPKPNQATPDRAPPTPSAQDLQEVEAARLAKLARDKADALARRMVPGFGGGH